MPGLVVSSLENLESSKQGSPYRVLEGEISTTGPPSILGVVLDDAKEVGYL
jgi:hypothetical protein